MRSLFRDEYGAPTARGRQVGIATGLFLVLACGIAAGRVSASPAPKASVVASTPHAPLAAPARASLVGATGTADDQAGAIAMALQTDCTLGGPLVTSPTQYEAAVARLLMPSNVGNASSIAQSEATQLDQQTGVVSAAAHGTRVFIECVPLGYRVESFAIAKASVSVWTEQLIGIDQQYTPAASYVTETLNLEWTSSGWKLNTSTVLDNQWAPNTSQPSLPQASVLPAQMTDFTPIGG